MRSSKTLTALLITGLFAASSVFAATPNLDKREHRQKTRIVNGVESGELTATETKRLVRGQRQLHRMARLAKADGVVTAGERARLHHKANKESRKIYRQKHDEQER